MKFRTVKERLFLAFFIYSAISFLVSFVCFILFRQMENIDRTTSSVNTLYNHTLQALRKGQEFFAYETINIDFYKNGKSEILNEHNRLLKEVDHLADSLMRVSHKKDAVTQADIQELRKLINQYNDIYRQIIAKIKHRGFWEHGLEGRMRQYIHELESSPKVNREQILTLRRHEKDYFIRNDTLYVFKLITQGKVVQQEITNARLSPAEKEELTVHLNSYLSVFRSIVKLDYEIGHRRLFGLSQQLNQTSTQIDQLVEKINADAINHKSTIMSRIQSAVVAIITFSVILVLLLSISFKYVLDREQQQNGAQAL